MFRVTDAFSEYFNMDVCFCVSLYRHLSMGVGAYGGPGENVQGHAEEEYSIP